MSGYKDFILDLPKRSIKILETFEPRAKIQNLEVTLLLMVATTVFVMSKERLGDKHPSDDRKRPENVELFEALKSSQNGQFVESPFCPEDGKTWAFGRLPTYQDVQNKYLDAKPLGTEKVSQVTALIRNALSHGSILTDGSPIKKLVLISERRKDVLKDGRKTSELVGYQFLVIPVLSFHKFLDLWLKFLCDHKVDCSDVLALFDAA